MIGRRTRLILWLPLIFGAVLAAVGLQVLFGGRSTRFDEMALGKETSSYWAKIGDYPIHCSPPVDADKCLQGFKARGASEAALWLGNSQVHAINQMKAGDTNAPPLLHATLRERFGLDLLTFSQPNANLQEHLVLFQYLRARVPTKVLILPLVFDDLRETGLRSEIAAALDDPPTDQALARSDVGRRIVKQARASADAVAAIGSGKDDLKALRETTQEKTELFFNRWLDEHSPLWKTRKEARGALMENLFFLRNRILGITAQTARPLIAARRDMNIAALQEILATAQAAGIRVFVYIVPIRNDVAIPYVPAEYEEFKKNAHDIATRYGASFSNLEGVVPARYWGTKASTNLGGGQEIDFMHFQGPGHRILAEALADFLRAPDLKNR